jgi:Adenylate cyclase, family 3 (some proteins contain HAMP domain)
MLRGWISHLELLWDDPAFRSYFEAIGRHFRVIRYDVRGNGLSDREAGDVDLQRLVLDVEAVMDAAVPETQAVLYGATFGGPIAIAYAAAHPDRTSKLVLDGTYARGREITTPERQGIILETLRKLPEAGLLLLMHLTLPEPHEQAPYRRPDQLWKAISPQMVVQLYSLAFRTDVSNLLSEISAPTLVMHRRGSQAIPLALGQELATKIPGARFASLPGREHNSWEGNAEASLRVLGDFLDVELELEEMSAAPDRPVHHPGEITAILFADIANSTALTERFGDAAFREKARELDSVLRTIIRGHAATPIDGKLLGDGVLAVFTSARQAIEAATRCGEAAKTVGLALHLGIHAGDVIREENNVYGGAVNIAARISSLCEPGRLLVSATVRDLARTSAGVLFEDQGERTLKGIEEPVRVFEVRWRE